MVDEIRGQAVSVAETFLSGSATRDVVEPTVNSILREGRGGIVSLGLVLALWSASPATTRMIEAVAIAYELQDRRSAWRRRALALGMTVVGIAVVVIVLPVLVGRASVPGGPSRVNWALGRPWRRRGASCTGPSWAW